MAPIPPAFATATDKEAGHAPAIGASSIGRRNPYFAQNAPARVAGQSVAIVVWFAVFSDPASLTVPHPASQGLELLA
ncbi:MAG TPA: hypothetical protein VKB88_40130 [Bryobacteraceae bacterium]|nr:hypothetical protein [Bryobacteraceae bacterium]